MEVQDVQVMGGKRGCRFDATTPILFVHGMWHAAWCWEEHFLEFFEKRGLAAHALNLRGHGGRLPGPRSLRWTSLSDYAQDLFDAVAHFRHKPILVGHSLGCLLVEIGLEKISPPAAILLAPTRHQIFRTSTVGFIQRHPWRSMELLLSRSLRRVVATPQLGHEMLFSPGHPKDEVKHYCSLLQDESFRVATELLLGIGPGPTNSPNTRVLVLGGGSDRAVPRNAVESVASSYGIQAEFFEGIGHDMMLDPNWQLVADRICCWLGHPG